MDSLLTDIKSYQRNLEALIRHCEHLERDVAFYSRILKQAVLTHGELEVNPALAADATATKKVLSFGDGKVTLIEDPF